MIYRSSTSIEHGVIGGGKKEKTWMQCNCALERFPEKDSQSVAAGGQCGVGGKVRSTESVEPVMNFEGKGKNNRKYKTTLAKTARKRKAPNLAGRQNAKKIMQNSVLLSKGG